MIIKLFDKTELFVTQAEATRVTDAINRGAAMIQIKGMTLNPKAIAVIIPGGYTEVDIAPVERRLPRPDYRGEPSPALEKMREKWGRTDVSTGKQKTT